jgi:hypothetical protein
VNATTQMEISRYVEQVRAALADLPAPVRDELLEDLPEHLAEVLAEGEGSLVDRLGEPSAYAAELRASAALDTPPAAPGFGQRAGAAWQRTRDRLHRVDRRVGPVLGYQTASEFMRLLRPGWWVLRGYLAAMLFAFLTSGNPPGIFPRPGGSVVIGFVALVGFVIGSVWLGSRRPQLTRWPRRILIGATALALVFGMVAVLGIDARSRHSAPGPVYYQSDPFAEVQDVYVYDSQGRLVEGARLFDENGQPILLGYPDRCLRISDDPTVVELGRYVYPHSARQGPQYVYPFCPEWAPFTLPTPEPSPELSASPGTSPSPDLSPESSPSPELSPATPTADPTVSESPATTD